MDLDASRFATAKPPIMGQRSFLAGRVPFARQQVILRAASCEPRAKHSAPRGCRDHEVRHESLRQAADLVVPPGENYSAIEEKKPWFTPLPKACSRAGSPSLKKVTEITATFNSEEI